MDIRRMKLLLIVTLLVFGMAGGVSVVAAATSTWNPGSGHEPDFLSPDWKVPTYTPMSDPAFLSPDWKVPAYTPISDPGLLSPSWKMPNYTPMADPGFSSSAWKVPNYTPMSDSRFMNSNWSVQQPVSFRYSLIDPSRINNYHLDPFATDADLRAQGWHITNSIW